MGLDVRWQQRLINYARAFAQLKQAVELAHKRTLSELEQQGLIQAFEYTHELAWKTLKDFLEEQGLKEIYGSKDVTRESFKLGIIENGEVWMDMIKNRNQTSHTYNLEVAKEIVDAIIKKYYQEFADLLKKLNQLKIRES